MSINEPQVRSDAIDCPWCIAKAGEPCIMPDGSSGYLQQKVHDARVVPRSVQDAWIASGQSSYVRSHSDLPGVS